MSLLPVAGFVLAGGQSSRMGQNKALLMLEGKTLVERAFAKLESVCVSVAIAGGGADLTPYGEVLADGAPGRGPLGGIVAALNNSSHQWCIFLAVDVPLLPAEFVRQLARAALASSAIAVLPRVHGRIEPTCAAYQKAALPGLQLALSEGRLKITSAVQDAGPVDMIDVADDKGWFANVNTPEDFARTAASFQTIPPSSGASASAEASDIEISRSVSGRRR